MNITVSAVYEQGVLHLFNPLKLPESTSVQIQVWAKHQYRQSAFRRRLAALHDLFLQIEQDWSNDLVRQLFPQILQTDLKMLWHLCQPPHSEFCAMLELSAMHLEQHELTLKHVAVFQFGIELLDNDELTEADFDACYERLVDAELFPSLPIA